MWTERHLEQAQSLADRERDAGVAVVRQQMRGEQGRPSSGICLDCDEPIPLARLAVYPAAVRCVGCQTDQDRREG